MPALSYFAFGLSCAEERKGGGTLFVP